MFFLNNKGKKWEEVPKVYFDALEESCINFALHRRNNPLEKIDFHSLRHTFASWLAVSGVDLHKIMVLMGHQSIQMTLRYARLDPDCTKKHVEELAISLSHAE